MIRPDGVYKRGGSSGYPEYPDPAARFSLPEPVRYPLFPSRFGIPSVVPTIFDVLSTNRLYPDARSRRSGYGEPGYQGTATPSNPMM